MPALLIGQMISTSREGSKHPEWSKSRELHFSAPEDKADNHHESIPVLASLNFISIRHLEHKENFDRKGTTKIQISHLLSSFRHYPLALLTIFMNIQLSNGCDSDDIRKQRGSIC